MSTNHTHRAVNRGEVVRKSGSPEVRTIARRGSPIRRAFTLIDVIIALLLLSMGLLSVLALTTIGTRESHIAVGMATAESTARTALVDPALVDAAKTMADSPVTGFLNGYYVERTILQAMSHSVDLVQVNVFWGESGQKLAGLVSVVSR